MHPRIYECSGGVRAIHAADRAVASLPGCVYAAVMLFADVGYGGIAGVVVRGRCGSGVGSTRGEGLGDRGGAGGAYICGALQQGAQSRLLLLLLLLLRGGGRGRARGRGAGVCPADVQVGDRGRASHVAASGWGRAARWCYTPVLFSMARGSVPHHRQ